MISQRDRGGSILNYNPPVDSVVEAAPGDIYTLEARVRCVGNADPANPEAPVAPEFHRFQLQMDCSGYESGESGWVIPPRLDDFNDPNDRCCAGPLASTTPQAMDAFIDVNHPLYAFAAAEADFQATIRAINLPVQQACAHRILAGLLVVDEAYTAKSYCQGASQPEIYLASVRVRVSNDAAGTFNICMDDFNGMLQGETGGPDFTLFNFRGNGQDNNKVFPLVFECASISVTVPDCETGIAPNTYPANAIDARQPSNLDGTGVTGITTFNINTTGPDGANCLLASQFTTSFSPLGPTMPNVSSVDAVDSDTATIGLSGPIPTSRWTRVQKINDQVDDSSVCLGYLPGDVSQNRMVNTDDTTALVACLNGGQACGIHQYDMDRSEAASLLDLARHIEVITGAQEFSAWAGANLVASPCPL